MRRVFEPKDPALFVKRMRYLFAGAIAVGLVALDDWPARIMLVAFGGVFIALAHRLLGWHVERNCHPLTLDEHGLHSAQMAERYGAATIPWHEIDAIDLFAGPPRGSRWLRIGLRTGHFRDRLKRPPGDRWAGRDVNLLFGYEGDPEELLESVRTFWKRFGADGRRHG